MAPRNSRNAATSAPARVSATRAATAASEAFAKATSSYTVGIKATAAAEIKEEIGRRQKEAAGAHAPASPPSHLYPHHPIHMDM